MRSRAGPGRGISTLSAARIGAWAQAVLALATVGGIVDERRLWDPHLVLGLAVAALALIGLRPRRAGRDPWAIGRFLALVPIILDRAAASGLLAGAEHGLLQLVVSLGVVGVVEAAARRRVAPPRPLLRVVR